MIADIETTNEMNDTSAPSILYSKLRPNDALAHLSERLSAEVDAFEKQTGLKLVSVKPKREKETDLLEKLNITVR